MPVKGPPLWEVPEVVSGDWACRRQLADAIRMLSERCITSQAGGNALAEATGLVRAAAALLGGASKTSSAAWSDGSYHEDIGRYVDRGALVGRCNPIAPPLRITHADGVSRCTITLDERFVGAPGICHGGVVSAIFDQMCGHAVVWSGHRALTIRLTIAYLRPTPLHQPMTYSARVARVEGRALWLEGDCTMDGKTITTCHAEFRQIDRDTANAIFAPR